MASGGARLRESDHTSGAVRRWLLLAALLSLPSCDATATGPDDKRIGPEGGSVSLEEGAVQLLIPSGALAESLWFVAFKALNVPASPLLVPGTTWEVGPISTTFTHPVTLTVSFDPAALPAGVGEESLALYQVVDNSWSILEYGNVDQANNTVVGRTRSLGRFGIKGMELRRMEVAPTTTTIAPGGWVQLSAAPKGEDGRTLSSLPVSWVSSDTATATVDPAGIVTGKTDGVAVITVSSGTQEAAATITVKTPVALVEILPSDGSLKMGENLQLEATPRDASGAALTGRSVRWSSGNPAVVTVDSGGIALGRALGSAIVTATVEGISGMATVTVHGDLGVSTEALAGALVAYPYAQTLAASGGDGSYQWSLASGLLPPGLTLNPATGSITGTPSTAGTWSFTVRVQSAGQTADRVLSIQVAAAAVASVMITPASAGMAIGDTVTFTATAKDASGQILTDRSTVWASSNAEVASVSANGLVTGLKEGATTISARVGGFPAWATVTVRDLLAITDSTLATGVVSHPYADTLVAVGGDGDYTWALVEDTLPTGLSLTDSTGVLWGTPTRADSSRIKVMVESGDGQADTVRVSLVIRGVLGITTATLKAATEGATFADTLRALGGKAPYRWSLVAGNLPQGMTLNVGTGVISGTPTTSGTPSFTVKVESDDLQTDTTTLALTVRPTPVASITLSTTSAALTQGDTLRITATPRDAGGYALLGRTVTWTTGASGVARVSATGLVTAEGVGTTTITATSEGISASAAITVHAPLRVTTATLAGGAAGAAYDQTLAATGGDGVFTWAVSGGALPAGLSLDGDTGVISGVPVGPGTSAFTVRVSSGDGQTATRALSITIS